MNASFSHTQQKRAQSGNALVYVLVAIALLAALSFAVTQSWRGNASKLNEERARTYANEIIEFSNIISNAVVQLRLRGVPTSSLCFEDPSWPVGFDYDHAGCTDDYNKIFSLAGAGINWQSAPREAMDLPSNPDNLWHIYGDNEIENVGTTCGAASCAELLLVVDELHMNVCKALNERLNVTNPGDSIPADLGFSETRYIGAFDYNATIGDDAGGTPLEAKTAACFESGGEYVFYKVLISQ